MSLTGVMCLCEDNLTNLDEGSAFPDEFKKSVLSFHMEKYARELSEEEIEQIVSTETYYGFPLECSLFCSILMNFNIGSKYFRQPSVVLMDEINALRNLTYRMRGMKWLLSIYKVMRIRTSISSTLLCTKPY